MSAVPQKPELDEEALGAWVGERLVAGGTKGAWRTGDTEVSGSAPAETEESSG